MQKPRDGRTTSMLEEVKTVSEAVPSSARGRKTWAGGLGRARPQEPWGCAGNLQGDVICFTPRKDPSGCWEEKRLEEEGRREISCLEAVQSPDETRQWSGQGPWP